MAWSKIACLIEVWIDESERRTWFLFEAGRSGDSGGTEGRQGRC
jgi:hypothetical protein